MNLYVYSSNLFDRVNDTLVSGELKRKKSIAGWGSERGKEKKDSMLHLR